MLKMAGYCPFIAAFSKNFYYNSIIVTTLNSLPFLLANIRRNNIRKVVIVFDEYLEALQRMKPRIRIVDVRRALKGVNSREVERPVSEWNRYVKLLDLTLTSIHERKIVKWLEKISGNPLEIIAYMYAYMMDNMRKEEKVLEILEKMRSVIERLEEAANKLNTRERLVVRRLAKKLKSSLGVWVTFTGWERGKPINKLLLRWGNNSIVGPPGGRITQLIDNLVKNNVMVAVITTSVLSSRITNVAKSIPPHKSLEHIPIRVTKYKRMVTFNLVNLNPMKYQGGMAVVNTSLIEFFIERLEKMKGNYVVIVNKIIFKHLVQALGNRVELAGDPERGVYDYAIVRKGNGGSILLTYAHGRISMGVDSPLGGADRIWVVYGVRRPPEEYVKVSLSNLARRIPRLSDTVASVRLFGRVRQGEAGGNGYIVLEEDKIWVYTGWDYRYDIHILVQVLGRWFLLPLRVVHVNHKYFQGLARTPFYSLEPLTPLHHDTPTLYIGEDGKRLTLQKR
ncbi:MAG: hypothetical protein DRO12_05115 [Thermoprotei archaeon]|nr:MAG: hypothetical protein DRO12_05115 [Thermoprotei archaeon]